MLFSALSGPRLLRALRASAAGSRAPLSGFSCARSRGLSPAVRPRLPAQRCGSLRGHKSLCLASSVPRPPARWLSSAGQSSAGQSSAGQSSAGQSSAGQSSDDQLIYTGSLGNAVRGVKAFSYSTSGASLLLLPHIMVTTGLSSHSWTFQLVFCGVVGVFTFITPVLLHLITRGYVVRLYHSPAGDAYTAVTYSLFLTEKRTTFRQEQVRIPSVSRMFTTFYADGTGMLVNPELFSLPQDYNHLMGYDKPFSFSPDQLD
ncbi:transmembrane protein 70, mitochondrial isoform X1 [Eucyclogobius newberryi]|uniref:transmembrane protein 70, mitochondrial isoform X1 n=1 Tax=Eucyclogobius newberryi TaxID=166745 RepID=UPI003B5B32F1